MVDLQEDVGSQATQFGGGSILSDTILERRYYCCKSSGVVWLRILTSELYGLSSRCSGPDSAFDNGIACHHLRKSVRGLSQIAMGLDYVGGCLRTLQYGFHVNICVKENSRSKCCSQLHEWQPA